MEDQEGKDESGHTSGDKTPKQSAAELFRLNSEIKRQQHKSKPGLLAAFSAYLLLVGTVIGGGVLAFYTGHSTAMQIIFYISIALLLSIPLILACYLGFSIHRRYPFLKKMVLFFARNSNAIMSVCSVIAVGEIVRCVWKFPLHPRMYLAEMLANLAIIALWIMGFVMRQIDQILNLMDGMNGNIGGVIKILEKIVDPPPPN